MNSELTVSGPYQYDQDSHPAFRIDSADRLIALVYASDGDEEAAEALAKRLVEAMHQFPSGNPDDGYDARDDAVKSYYAAIEAKRLRGDAVDNAKIARNDTADAEIRNDPNLLGREAYEASLRACPNYTNGDPRRSWDQLGEAERWSWSRPIQRP